VLACASLACARAAWRRAGVPVHIGAVISLFISLVGLVAIGSTVPPLIQQPPTPDPQPTPVPPRKPITSVFCDDETGSYPKSLFWSAAGKMVDWIIPPLQANQSGVTAYVQLINADSYSIASTAMTIQIRPSGRNR
jgi:hypothetical protein